MVQRIILIYFIILNFYYFFCYYVSNRKYSSSTKTIRAGGFYKTICKYVRFTCVDDTSFLADHFYPSRRGISFLGNTSESTARGWSTASLIKKQTEGGAERPSSSRHVHRLEGGILFIKSISLSLVQVEDQLTANNFFNQQHLENTDVLLGFGAV